jgi:hypothetical protein
VAHFPEGEIGNKHQNDLSEHGKACRSNGEELANIWAQNIDFSPRRQSQCIASGQCQNAISEGYDPTIGIMHEGNDGLIVFVFD